MDLTSLPEGSKERERQREKELANKSVSTKTPPSAKWRPCPASGGERLIVQSDNRKISVSAGQGTISAPVMRPVTAKGKPDGTARSQHAVATLHKCNLLD